MMREHQTILQKLSGVASPVLLLLLLSADLVFILLHIANPEVQFSKKLLLLNTDRGYSEVFQYIKEFWLALVFFIMLFRTRQGVYAAWALLFTYLLFDDSASIHETVGELVAAKLNYVPMFGLRATDLGQLTVSLMVGSAILALMIFFHSRSNDKAKNATLDLTLLLGVLVFFGVFVDMLDNLPALQAIRGMTVVEDGGEMLAMSLLTSYAVHLLEGRGHDSGLLWQLIKSALTKLWPRRGSKGK
jgi:hypothetical protein